MVPRGTPADSPGPLQQNGEVARRDFVDSRTFAEFGGGAQCRRFTGGVSAVPAAVVGGGPRGGPFSGASPRRRGCARHVSFRAAGRGKLLSSATPVLCMLRAASAHCDVGLFWKLVW
ncbi:hypothetical protein GCM10027174_45260 [Salinifilum aidingensis]